jgi:hypothetical protein
MNSCPGKADGPEPAAAESKDESKSPVAWQPLTPGGVAAFAGASWGRLLLVQGIIALLAAGSLVWFVHEAWYPVITEAISRLPEQGEIRAGRLDWFGDSPVLLAEGPFLAFSVDLDHVGEARSPAHVQIEFGRTEVQVFSLLGFVRVGYAAERAVAFNHGDVAPWWGAWAPAFLAIVSGLVVAGLMVSWMLLATLYCVPAWLIGFFGNRELGLGGSWRLAGASLMPGALFMVAAIILYGLGGLDLVRLGAAAAAHLVIGWVYLLVSPTTVPRHAQAEATKLNPFIPQPAEQASPASKEQEPKKPGD